MTRRPRRGSCPASPPPDRSGRHPLARPDGSVRASACVILIGAVARLSTLAAARRSSRRSRSRWSSVRSSPPSSVPSAWPRSSPGSRSPAGPLLRAGIVLLGARLSLAEIAEHRWPGPRHDRRHDDRVARPRAPPCAPRPGREPPCRPAGGRVRGLRQHGDRRDGAGHRGAAARGRLRGRDDHLVRDAGRPAVSDHRPLRRPAAGLVRAVGRRRRPRHEPGHRDGRRLRAGRARTWRPS